MLESVLSILGTVASGGLTGLVGAWLTARTELQKLKEMNRHEEAMAEADRELARLEAEKEITVARTEGEAAVGVADAQAFAASYKHDRATYVSGELTTGQRWLMVLVDFSRGAIRPFATVYLVALASYLTYVAVQLLDKLGGSKVEAIAEQLVPDVFQTILYIASTVIFWWFGVRPRSAPRAG